MIRLCTISLICLTLAGCCCDRHAVIRSSRPVANLAIGPTSDHTALSQAYTYRSSWPSVRAGYLFDDLSTYTEVIYDDESYISRFNAGSFNREAVSVRSRVLVR